MYLEVTRDDEHVLHESHERHSSGHIVVGVGDLQVVVLGVVQDAAGQVVEGDHVRHLARGILEHVAVHHSLAR